MFYTFSKIRLISCSYILLLRLLNIDNEKHRLSKSHSKLHLILQINCLTLQNCAAKFSLSSVVHLTTALAMSKAL